MKLKKVHLILLTIVLFFVSSEIYSQTTEQTIQVLLNNKFGRSFTLDSSWIEFKPLSFPIRDDMLEFTFNNDGEGGYYLASGFVKVDGNKIHYVCDMEYNQPADEEIKYDGELRGFGKLPNVNYRYELSTPWDDLDGGIVQDGEEVLCDGHKCIKYSKRIILNKTAKRYTAPDFSSDLLVSNDVIINEYKLPNNYVLLPGVVTQAFGVIENQVNRRGEKGSWYVFADNLYPSPYPYYWVFVPENSSFVYEGDLYENPDFEHEKILKSMSDDFLNAIYKQNFSYLTDEEYRKLDSRRWWDWQDYSIIFENVGLSDNRAEIKAGATKRIKENLRLRKNDTLNSSVITTIGEGSKVKILATGEPEVIDDIYSYWVKVQIVNGTDRDGNPLQAGTTGWCFGGYLE